MSDHEPMLRTHIPLSRRAALRTVATGIAGLGASLLFGCGDDDGQQSLDGEPEVTSLRFTKPPPVCVVAQYVAEEYLREEGFNTIEYVTLDNVSEVGPSTSAGRVDFAMNFAAPIAVGIDRGDEISVLAGMHVGCFELFATDRIAQPSDLKGGRVAVTKIGADAADYNFIAGIFQYVGIDVNHDVTFVEGTPAESIDRLAAGEVDGLLAFPPLTQDLRARGIGHVILSSTEDSPWSQYFCCLVTGNKRFIEKYPKATKRVVRAYVKAAEHCARQPEAVADFLIARSYMTNRDYAGEMMRSLPYDVWEAYDPDDTLRFYALRLHEAGIIRAAPEEIIARGTDWRFLNELKQELAFTPGKSAPRFSWYCDLASPAVVRASVGVNDPANGDG